MWHTKDKLKWKETYMIKSCKDKKVRTNQMGSSVKSWGDI